MWLGRGYQEVGAASGWNLWVWLVSVVLRRYIIDILIIIITFPYSTCISSFFGSIIPISLFIFICFFVLVYVIFVQCYNLELLKIIGIKVCYYLIKIFLHNKIHFKINTVDSHYSELEGTSSKVHYIRRFIITRVDTLI